MNGTLYIVGTPIGNLKDITLRAIEILKQVDYIACEDTRNSLKLLNHFEIKEKKLISYHNFNEQSSSKNILNLLKEGKNIALISDAGMPTIADPGFEIIKEVRENNLNLEIIPGVSALTTVMSLSNMGPEFTFLGFGKNKKGQLKNQLKSLDYGTYVFFVAPHKLEYLLDSINEIYPLNNKIFLAKELTKIYEKHYYGSALEVKEQLTKNYKGEFSLVLKIEKNKKIKVNKYEKTR